MAAAQAPLDDYIQAGLANNLALKQKETNYEKSLEALKEARSLFFPNISFNARYSVAEGGRTIDLPIGDLLNPVYSTLNQLIHQNLFPPVENQSFMFLRPHEQETKIRMVQPVFNTDIYYNSVIKRELSTVERISVAQYRQELAAEIRKAWYRTAMADAVLRMLTDTRKLLEENIRVNRKLVDNGKITIDNLYRSETERSLFEQKMLEAGRNREMAAAYLNFLVNKPLTDPVIITDPDLTPYTGAGMLYDTVSVLANREEMKMLDQYGRISELQIKMNRAGALPNLLIVADYGIQGEEYKINKEADFAQASAVLTWDLFSGYQNRARINQARLQKEILDRQVEQTRQEIRLEVTNAWLELDAAGKAITAAEAQLKTAREGFRLVKRRYEEGEARLIEYIDARAALTQAEENLIVKKFTWLSDYAEYEKVAGTIKY
jgi:outer membrane protein TolC